MSDSETSVPSFQSAESESGNSLPLQKVKIIIGTVPDILPISQEALFAFAKATELFIAHLVRGVHGQYGTAMDYDELATFIYENDEYSYLHDFFPRRLAYSEAVELTSKRLDE